MSESLPGFDIGGLSVPQRLALIAELWDSIPESPEALGMPQWHRQELERRLAAANASPDASIPWEEILESIGSRSPDS